MKQGTHLQLWYKSLDLNQKIDVMKDRIEQSKENIRCEKNLLHLRKTILRDLKDQKNLLHLKKVLKKHQAEKIPKYAMKKRMKNELCKRCKKELKVWTPKGNLTNEIVIGICKKCERQMLS